MKTSKTKSRKTTIIRIVAIIFVATAATVFVKKPVHADSLDSKIRQLQNEVNSANGQISQLSKQADTLNNKIATFNAQIAELQSQIQLNTAKSQQLNEAITKAQADLVTQKSLLNENVRSIYQQGSVSSLEILAGSDNFSDYVNKQEYSQRVKDKVQDSLATIAQLKVSLEQQQKELTIALANQKTQRDQLNATRAQQADLLAQTQGQEAAYQQQVQEKNSNIATLRAQQAAAISAVAKGGIHYGGSGGYPWANAPFPNSIPDPWGMYQRQCVSYTAWKVDSTGRDMPYWGGKGNANQWPNNADRAGIPRDGNPRVGDIGIIMAGPYGHAFYVESVHGSTVTASQYNANNDGAFSTSDYSISSATFIHF